MHHAESDRISAILFNPLFSGFGSELAIFLVLCIYFNTSCIVIIAEFDVEIFVLSLY